ncbi:hypothetical protein [Endozoicomonas sp. 8E]|uniref:hypothetical protein n=1 Tax=Endozoicomonas sp. 8E TaxID=3035692 RepID=UPI0029392009|nr:hypothetical protein [Endozoicomonas sp. 8E]WOG27025.1 hypothetical protein P6910_21105 [Endozoicomonas sp. 8E]
MLLSFSFTSQAESLTIHFIVELEQNTGFPNRNFFIKRDQHGLPDNPSDVANVKGYAESGFPPDKKQHRVLSYGVKTSLLSSKPYAWVPITAFVDVEPLLKRYWNPDSAQLNPIEQKEATSMLGEYPFATITAMFSSGHNPPQYQQSKSSGHQAPQANTQPAGSFISPLYSGSGGGEGDPQEHSHTLSLNCFVYPCHGVCRFRSSFGSRAPAEWPLDSVGSSTDHTEALPEQSSCPHLANGYCFSCMGHFDFLNAADSRQALSFERMEFFSDIQLQYASAQLFQVHSIAGNTTRSCNYEEEVDSDEIDVEKVDSDEIDVEKVDSDEIDVKEADPDPTGFRLAYTIDPSGQQSCEVTVVAKEVQKQQCGALCANAKALQEHKRRKHREQKICYLTIVGKDGQQQKCGMVCKNPKALSDHKRKDHTEQQTCDKIVVTDDGQKRLCGKICKNSQALSCHKSRYHTGRKTCNLTVVTEDGKQRQCGLTVANARTLADHRSRHHTRQQTCDLIVIGKDRQQRLCGRVCRSTRALSDHKSRYHSVQQTCQATVIGKNGQPQQCGKLCRSTKALSDHKRKNHNGQKTCDVTVLWKDGQRRPCAMVGKSTQVLYSQKRIHRKRKPVPDHDSGL